MTMSLSVREVLRSPLPFQRGNFSLGVMGFLIARAGDCRIIDDPGAVDELGRAIQGRHWQPDPDRPPPAPAEEVGIRIHDATFLDRLRAEIPPVTDPEYLYFDTAMVCGNTRIEAGEVVLENIWYVCLVRDGQRVRALSRHR